MRIQDLNIGVRLALGFGALILLTAAILAVGVLRLRAVAQESAEMMALPLAKERVVSDWYSAIQASVQRVTAVAKTSDMSLGTFFAEEMTQATRNSNEQQKRVEALLQSPTEKALFAALVKNRMAYIATRDAISKKKLEGQTDEANRIFTAEYQPAAVGYLKGLRALLDEQRAAIDAAAVSVRHGYERGLAQMLVLGAVALLVAAVLAFMITRSITRPLGRALTVAQTVAAGDLTSDVGATGRDETGRLLRALDVMGQRLRETVGQVRHGADGIATASSQIASGNLDLSTRTEEQASALQQTAASMEQMTATVRQNADNARQANQLAQSTSDLATRGGVVVGNVVSTMAEIHTASRKIVDIISVIDGIAFQTNILALNAAVEAARAGEQGRGFAVVAGEVRTLAQRSASAAHEIKGLIDDSVQRVDAGNRLVEEAGGVIREVVQGVRRVTDIVGEITSASQEQTTGLEQVNQAITQMDQVTQQNAALVEEAAAATGSLESQAAQLVAAVAVFRLRHEGAPRLAA
ncbi:methyl-accepting chemotaxis protein [Xylophilus ampelinus]|uniref:Methyl-accepting chemotaxis protein n=1 Tax=Xylophilus ampelinus TaxID=54067 RepID=A0A318SFZ5_9BURK|nr:methyl-accepting chemotaxis protein [Xylophilus ampelinus]MCS4510653.1 methyl-accepting chemotaxis protein [Xylophilus ampelinus]PYE76345.1 methyl-accepting chemotaxis protein [Xylophilus ampelinus]